MAIDKKFVDKFINITSRAALASSYFVGKKDKIAADKAAVDSMRSQLNKLDMQGQIVIGEGELDEAPMLYIGEKLGTNNGPKFDIAVDPLEGTNFAANNLPGALSVMAVAEKNSLFNAPETYMEKIAVGKNIENGVVDLDFSIEKNLKNLADAKNKKLEDLTVCLLERDRHQEIIDKLNKMKINKKLISDGDVSGALYVTNDKFGVDMFIGTGGGPEGVLAASALDANDCFFQGRFIFETEKDQLRANEMGIEDFNRKYNLDEIISGDSIFCATGITSGDLVTGIEIDNNEFVSETLITHKSTGLKKVIRIKQKI